MGRRLRNRVSRGRSLPANFGNKVTQLETCQNRIETRRPEVHPRTPGIAIAIETATATETATVIATIPKGIAKEETTTAVTVTTTAVAAEDAVRRPNPSP